MRTRKIVIAASCLFAAFMLTSSLTPEVTTTKTIKMNTIANARLSVGIQSILDVAEEHDFHEEIEEVLYEGVVQNTLPGYDWNEMVMANVDDKVNMRANPDEEAEILGKLPKGAAGTILEEDGDWTKISSGSVEAWVSNEFLLFGAEAEEKALEIGTYKATVNTEGLRIRKGASADAAVLAMVEKGTTYVVVSQPEGWVEVQLGGSTGFVSAEYVDVAFQLEKAMSMEEIRAAEEKARQEAEKKRKAEEERKRKEAEAKAANASDVAILAAIVQLEAGGEPYEGKLAVASVIMNRVRSPRFPNTVRDVVYAPGQFTPVRTKSAKFTSLIQNGASAQCVQAAKQALGGIDNVGGRLYFRSARMGGTLIIGNHAFY